MINTARHGKILAITMDWIVLAHKARVSAVSASQAHLADSWESAAGIREEGKNNYLIIIVCGITQKLLATGKQIT